MARIILLVLGVLLVIGGLIAIILSSLYVPEAVLIITLVGYGAVMLGPLAFLASYGLGRGRRWARPLAYAVAGVGLLFFPLGTILGSLVLWYLIAKPCGSEG
jgi:hypothetical protein